MKYLFLISLMFNLCWADAIPKNSIYQIKSGWKDQNNQSIQLKNFSGQKVIIGMVYTKCPHACPMTISKIQEIEREVNKISKDKYKIVLASFDPKGDTPEHLKNYMKSRKLNEEQWTFLSAPNDMTARELAIVLGINYKQLEDGEFSHSNVISVLDASGVRVAKIEGLSAKVDPIVESFKK